MFLPVSTIQKENKASKGNQVCNENERASAVVAQIFSAALVFAGRLVVISARRCGGFTRSSSCTFAIKRLNLSKPCLVCFVGKTCCGASITGTTAEHWIVGAALYVLVQVNA